MSYKPFKMRGSPFKRNFGVGEKEETSPGKNVLGKVLSGLGDVVQAGVDAGAGTDYQKQKEKKRSDAESEKKKEEKDKLAHDRAKELLEIGNKNKPKVLEGDINGDGIVDAKEKEALNNKSTEVETEEDTEENTEENTAE